MDLIGKLAGDLPDVRTETTRERRLLVVRMLLRHLDQFPGGTWQERWEASGLNDAKTPVRDRERTKERRAFITTGLKTVLALRLIQPSLEAFRSNKFMGYQGMFLPAQGDPLVDQFVAAVSRHEVSQVHRDHALFDVAFALTCHGLSFADLNPEAMLYHSQECRRLGLTTANIGDPRRHQGQVAWQVLHRMGHFPDGTPPRMKELLLPGQRSIEELVAFRPIDSGPVRQLIIDYLTRRASEVDYSTLKNLARTIAHTFWRKIEAINPGQRDLHIDQAVYAQWTCTVGPWKSPSGGPPGRPRAPSRAATCGGSALAVVVSRNELMTGPGSANPCCRSSLLMWRHDSRTLRTSWPSHPPPPPVLASSIRDGHTAERSRDTSTSLAVPSFICAMRNPTS
jgi:hypothetical protein